MSGRDFLRLLRLSDSGLPVGGFAHSGGVEALARNGTVTSAEELATLLQAYRALSLDRFDAWFARTAHRAVRARDEELLARISLEEVAARPARAQRSACLQMGRAAVALGQSMVTDDQVATQEWVTGALGGQAPWATAVGAVAATLGVDEEGAAGAVIYSAVAAQVSAAVRLGLIGADAAQGVLAGVLNEPVAPYADRWSSFAPLIDIAQMEQESIGERLFAS